VDEELQAQTRTIAAAPIRMQKRIIGVLEAINPREAQFSEVQLELLRGIAGLAGTAIAHAQLFSETQAARLRYAGLFEDSVDPILISDLKGRITDANHRAESFLGYSSAELLGESMLDLHEADLKRLPQDLGRLEVGQTVSYASVARVAGMTPPVEVYVKRSTWRRSPSCSDLRDTRAPGAGRAAGRPDLHDLPRPALPAGQRPVSWRCCRAPSRRTMRRCSRCWPFGAPDGGSRA
jgi:PAS domain S-box-containing protein